MTKIIFTTLIAVLMVIASSSLVSAQGQFCGATVGEGDCGANCQATNITYSFVNCNCSGSIQSLRNCTQGQGACVSWRTNYDYEQVTTCNFRCTSGGRRGGAIPVLDIGKASAACSYSCNTRKVSVATGQTCTQYAAGGCRANYVSVRCGGSSGGDSGSGGTSCSAQAACSPTCPAGTVPYDTGSGTTVNTSCSYQTGNVSGGSCETRAVNATCWNQIVPPAVTVTNLDNTSSLGCVSGVGYMGNDANNTNRIKVDYAGNNSANPYHALLVWFAQGSNTPPSINKIYDSGNPQLLDNGSYGMLVKYNGTSWSDIYVPGTENGQYTWVKSGTIGSGLRTEVLGANGKKMVGVSNVDVSTAGTTVSLTFDIQYYHSGSGVSDFEQASQGTTTIHATTNAQSSFLPSGGNTISVVPQWFNSNKSYVLDLVAPVADPTTFSIVDNTRLDVQWKFADSTSSVARVVGDANLETPNPNADGIDDETSGVANYQFGSGSTGSQLYSGTHLWSVNNDADRTDRIDFNNNSSGRVAFTINAFDSACNVGTSNATFPFGIAWIATKGGFVHAGDSSGIDIIPIVGSGSFSDDTYWDSPFSFKKNQADVTSELLSVVSTTVGNLLYPDSVGSVRSTNHNDRNNISGYWYSELAARFEKQQSMEPTKYEVVELPASSTVSNNTTTTVPDCTGSKMCVVKVAGDLRINSGFVCNKPTLFLVEGATNIEPDVTSPDSADGCMIVSKGDITVLAGDYKSSGSTYPKYDIIEAYMITDGAVKIPAQDSSQSVKDGLLVHGSMLGFGNEGGSSIEISRSFTALQNRSFPVLALHFDMRYLGFAPMFFGGDTEGFRREVGFKPL